MIDTVSETARTISADPARAAQYRQAGWWPGEALADSFSRHVHADPDAISIADEHGIELSRRQLWDSAASAAKTLHDAGIAEGAIVIIYLPNTIQWQVWFLACLQVGAVPATLPISTDRLTLAHVFETTGAHGIVTCEQSRNASTGQWARSIAEETPRPAAAIVVGDTDATCDTYPGDADRRLAPAGIEHIMFTSSSTGMPKAVMHTADTLAAGNVTFAQRYQLTASTPIFMPSPLGHSVGAWHGARLALFLGAKLVLQDRWQPERGLELIDEHACVFTAAATPFLKDIVDANWPAGRPKMPTMTTFLCGGAPVPPVLLEQAEQQAPAALVSVLWGMTEGTGTTCLPNGERSKLTTSAGKPVPGLELTILDADASGSGELAMRGPQVCVGYLGQEELFNSLITDDGFFRTGDLAWLDEDGYLHLSGRLKDMIIRGGVNISPVPIEDAIAAHPSVKRVAVIGGYDDRLGERITAIIVPAGEAPSLDDLNFWLSDRGLDRRKLPEVLHVVDDMPVTAAGKIRKADLQNDFGTRND